jgi:RHS repeat-associated protein
VLARVKNVALGRTASNDVYAWDMPVVSRAHTRNGLNQYESVSGVAQEHDARGNLIADATRHFCYDYENHLIGVASVANDPCVNASTLDLEYDPLGRLLQTDAAGVVTQFLYDGDRLVAEYDGAGTLLRRYVHGAGVDEPILWYEGATTADRRWLIADAQGSVLAAVNASGGVLSGTRTRYGPFGEPSAWVGSRFRYTGQIALPEAQLYHFKARVLCPECGRFLQTDPVGYSAGDLNLYAYVGNDPLNRVDPTGLSDLNLFNPEAGQYAAADAFDAPGLFTITGHGGPNGLRDDRGTARGPMLNADRLLSAARGAGLREGQGILLAGCNCASDSFAQRLAILSGSDVYAANGFVMYPSTNDSNPSDDTPAYQPGNAFSIRVMEDRSGGGEERGFVRFTPNGQASSGPGIRSISVNPRTGMATARYAPVTGSRLGQTVTRCVDKDKC